MLYISTSEQVLLDLFAVSYGNLGKYSDRNKNYRMSYKLKEGISSENNLDYIID